MDTKRAKRMAPEARREHILDTAIQLILEAGHSGFTLEQIAKAEGISKALIYKYFSKREELLTAILDREFDELNGRGLATIPSDIPIERVIRGTVERAIRYYAERGPIIRLLSSDPAIATAAGRGNQQSRVSTTEYFVKRSVDYYGIPEEVATIAVTLVVNAPIHSMKYLRRKQIDLDQIIEVWSEFILAGWRGLQARYGEHS